MSLNVVNTEVCDRIENELRILGNPNTHVYFARNLTPSSNDHILQRFIAKWNSIVYVENEKDVVNGDRLTVTSNPFAVSGSPKVCTCVIACIYVVEHYRACITSSSSKTCCVWYMCHREFYYTTLRVLSIPLYKLVM